MVLLKKYKIISLASELYYKDENELDDLIYIAKKCLLKSNCIGITYKLENKQCKFYQDFIESF